MTSVLEKLPLCCVLVTSFYWRKPKTNPQRYIGTALKFLGGQSCDKTQAFDISVADNVFPAVERARVVGFLSSSFSCLFLLPS